MMPYILAAIAVIIGVPLVAVFTIGWVAAGLEERR